MIHETTASLCPPPKVSAGSPRTTTNPQRSFLRGRRPVPSAITPLSWPSACLPLIITDIFIQCRDLWLMIFNYIHVTRRFSLAFCNLEYSDIVVWSHKWMTWGLYDLPTYFWCCLKICANGNGTCSGSKSARAKPLHWTSCLKIAEDVAQGLSYIHQAWRLVHGNLKSSNVLLGSDFEACLTDYCLSALANPTDEQPPDFAACKAPEALKLIHSQHQAPTSKSDVFSFGILLLELLSGRHPSQQPTAQGPDELVEWVKSNRDDENGEDNSKVDMLLEVGIACSMNLPEQRPTMWQVLKMIQEIKEAAVMEDN